METILECSIGFVKIERIINEDDQESVKLTTDIGDDDGDISLTLGYSCKEKADDSFNNLSNTKPDELKKAILQMLGL